MNSVETIVKKNNPDNVGSAPSLIDGEQIKYTQTRIESVRSDYLQKNRIIAGFQPGRWLESYKMLRTRCLLHMDTMGWNMLAITSPSGNTGNSLTAANLAIAIAMEFNRSILLIDANFRNPSICNLFGIHSEAGLGDYLINDTPINELLINPDIDRLVLLPAGKALINSTEMLRSPKMISLVEELKIRYPSRIIIFDLPPLLSQADTLAFSPYVDCILLVVDEGRTKTEELKQSALLLKEINVLGTVLNKVGGAKIKYRPE